MWLLGNEKQPLKAIKIVYQKKVGLWAGVSYTVNLASVMTAFGIGKDGIYEAVQRPRTAVNESDNNYGKGPDK